MKRTSSRMAGGRPLPYAKSRNWKVSESPKISFEKMVLMLLGQDLKVKKIMPSKDSVSVDKREETSFWERLKMCWDMFCKWVRREAC